MYILYKYIEICIIQRKIHELYINLVRFDMKKLGLKIFKKQAIISLQLS